VRLTKPSPAMVVALVALFVALSGTSYAALTLPRNSVGPEQIRNNAVTGPKVKAGSLAASDFKSSERLRLRGPRGSVGATGAAGPAGQPGPAGAVGPPGPAALVTTLTEGTATTLKAHSCYGLDLDGAAATTAAGNVLTAWISDSAGSAVVPNFVNVIPGARNLTTQGGAVGGALLCNLQSSDVSLPAGWVSHYKEITLP
jgi:hypothetical protein